MSGQQELIELLHRADWTQLWLSPEVNDGSALLIAPGRRYRLEDGAGVQGCDGQHPWEPREDDDEHGEVHWISGPEPPLPVLLRPAWLLRDSDLEVLGRVIACGHDAWHVAVTRRCG